MPDAVIEARELSKVYRLYAAPKYRMLDMFGLLRRNNGAFSEHPALDRVSLRIEKGEKVALIGRNGAGKSTFLKLVTQVILPSSGIVRVRGEVHALLQIGTGFHPDFTGRENVHSYLAHLGVMGEDAKRKFDEILDFAEIEDYIDQPMKTYSTGMAVRLMFATSTAIVPEVLVIDEVLGVGDAYFAHKSYNRMKELCEGRGTTLLLVTHDIYSAANLCERVIWIDQGRVLMDGDSATVIKGYEDSVREQEERRLRKKKLKRLKAEGVADEVLLLEVRSRGKRPLPCPLYFSRITLARQGIPLLSMPLGAGAFDERAEAYLQAEPGCWGEPTFVEGRETRAMLDYGSSFHKVAGVFRLGGLFGSGDELDFEVILDYWSAEPCDVVLRGFLEDEQEIDLGPLPPTAGRWAQHVATYSSEVGAQRETSPPEIDTSGIQGTGTVTLFNVRTRNQAGQETHLFTHGEPFELLVDYKIRKPDLSERCQVVVVFHRDGVHDTCRSITRDLSFDTASRDWGTIRLRLPKLVLPDGSYTVTLMVAEEGYYDQEQTVFYSINPGVYCCLVKVLEFVVREGGIIGSTTGVVIEGDWSLTAPANRQEQGLEVRGSR